MSSPTPTPNPQFLPPDLAEFMSRRMREVSANINACLIGSISAINSDGTVTVAVSFQKIIRGIVPIPNSNIMGDQIINYPALVNVPVFLYQGGGAYIKMPIAVNDPCLLLFCDRDMDNWFQSGQVAPPNSDRVHSINDAIALVGINNLQSPLSIPSSPLIQIIDRTRERLCQSGFLQPYAGSAAPSGWLLCYGQSISKTTYPDLFAIIGYTYGGSGNNFNIPDLRGRTVAGLDNMGGSNANVLTTPFFANRDSLGGVGGEEAHSLTSDENGPHYHDIFFSSTGGSGFGTFEEGAGVPNTTPPSGDSGAFSGPSAHSGLGNPHQTIQPTMVINWLIKI